MKTLNTAKPWAGTRSVRETLHLVLVAGLAVGLLAGQAYCCWLVESLSAPAVAAGNTRAPAVRAQPAMAAVSTLIVPRNP